MDRSVSLAKTWGGSTALILSTARISRSEAETGSGAGAAGAGRVSFSFLALAASAAAIAVAALTEEARRRRTTSPADSRAINAAARTAVSVDPDIASRI
jgi:hypothetical protein